MPGVMLTFSFRWSLGWEPGPRPVPQRMRGPGSMATVLSVPSVSRASILRWGESSTDPSGEGPLYHWIEADLRSRAQRKPLQSDDAGSRDPGETRDGDDGARSSELCSASRKEALP